MNEDEAKTKWCPLALNNACTRNAPDNPLGEPVIPDGAKCIASDCMMWRWDIAPARAEHIGLDVQPPTGYCGLAGKL